MTNGERIAKKREEKGISQAELARMVGYKSRGSINKLEIGKREIPKSMIVKIADVLEISPLELLGLDDLDKIGTDRPLTVKEWTVLETKLMMLNQSDLIKVIGYIDTLIAEHEGQQE